MTRPGKVRIIAGSWRGRRLNVLNEPGLRPTPDRVRETLFNWLQADIAGATCLDLFAGTGALGFEALSRGASNVIMIESRRALFENLLSQAETFGSDKHDIQQADALSWLQQVNQQFDIVFLDPPFNKGLIETSCQIVLERGLLKPTGKIYIEAEKALTLPDSWQVLKQKQTGQVQSVLLTHKEQ